MFCSERSTTKPDSLLELSVHCRSIWLEDTAVAERPVGAAGRATAVGVTVGVGDGVTMAVGVPVGVFVGV